MSVEAQQILAVSSFGGIVAATTFPSIGVRPRTPSDALGRFLINQKYALLPRPLRIAAFGHGLEPFFEVR